jgi:hypothetical protein
MTKTEQRWTSDTERCDGLAIVQGVDGFVVMPRDESLPVDKCPCCDKPFRTVKAARLVADMICPMVS